MNITKTLAANIASKLVESTISVKITNLSGELIEYTKILIFDSIKPVIKTAYEYAPAYFNTSQNATFVCDNSFSITAATVKYPCVTNSWSGKHIGVSRKQYDKICSLQNEIKELKDKKQTLLAEIESTLIKLRTSKNVIDSFPEAIPYLPNEGETSLIMPISDIRETLNSYK